MKTLMISALALAALATVARAQPASDPKALHEAVLTACAADQKKFCDGKEGKEGHNCMAASLPKASPACQAAIAKFQAAAPAPH